MLHSQRATEEESLSRPKSSIFDGTPPRMKCRAAPIRDLSFEQRRRNSATLRHKRESPGSSRRRGPLFPNPVRDGLGLVWLPKRNPSRTRTAYPATIMSHRTAHTRRPSCRMCSPPRPSPSSLEAPQANRPAASVGVRGGIAGNSRDTYRPYRELN